MYRNLTWNILADVPLPLFMTVLSNFNIDKLTTNNNIAVSSVLSNSENNLCMSRFGSILLPVNGPVSVDD